jgi:AcrR family transcriptional regulator
MDAIPSQTPARRGRWNKEERRAQIAAVTLEIIAREGVHGASLGRIAEAAGIAAPSLYNHFSGRTEILETASDLLLERVLAWIDSSTNPDMLERLREIGGSIHESRIGADQEWVITPLLELTAAARAEGLTEHMGRNQLIVLQKFVDIVEEGKRQGTIREDADAEVVGWMMMSLGWAKDFALLQGLDRFVDEGTADKILDRILSGIGAAPSRLTR